MGREVLFQIQQNSKFKEEYNILGFVDDTPSISNKFVNGFRVLGNSHWLCEYSSSINVIICLGNAMSRKNVARKLFNNKNISFPTFIADDVRISEEVSYGIGCIFCFSCIITVNIEIGDFVVLNRLYSWARFKDRKLCDSISKRKCFGRCPYRRM